MDGTIAQQSHSMLGHLCLPLRQASLRLGTRHFLLGGHHYSVSRCSIAAAMRREQEQLQSPQRSQRRQYPLPPLQAWRSYHAGYGGDLLAEAPGGGCSCCGDYLSMRDGRALISRPETGPSSRSIATVQAAASAQAEGVRSHEEEAEALEQYVKRRMQLFDHYKNREAEAVSASCSSAFSELLSCSDHPYFCPYTMANTAAVSKTDISDNVSSRLFRWKRPRQRMCQYESRCPTAQQGME